MKVIEVRGHYLNFSTLEFFIYYDENDGCWRHLNGTKFDMKKDLVRIVNKYPIAGKLNNFKE